MEEHIVMNPRKPTLPDGNKKHPPYLRAHNWVHCAHRLECTVNLNSDFVILKT